MIITNILKPDILVNKESLNYYFTNIINMENVDNIKLYNINNWTKIASLIYEYDVINNKNFLEQRKKILTSILGYYHLYAENKGIAVIFDLKNININFTLEKLYKLKKEIRKIYVNNTDLYYLKFLNENIINFNKPLYDINLSEIKIDIKKFSHDNPYENPLYNMIFFNQIHSPNPFNLDENEKNYEILKCQNIICEKNLVKELKK